MIRTLIKYGLWILVPVFFAEMLEGQDNSARRPSERVQLFTDRKLYITGENIQFSAIVLNDNYLQGQFQSRVLNVELISPDGKMMTSGKYAIENFSADGCLPVPADLLTGYYYLKAYTRWMRNESLDNYSFSLLKIINPYSAELSEYEHSDSIIGWIPRDQQPEVQASQGKIILQTGKEVLSPRENVDLQIINNIPGDFSILKSCISVVPSASWDSIRQPAVEGAGSAEIQYYPETRGITLSGRLLEEKTRNPVPNTLVNLSVIGDKDVMAIRTNSKGQFYFALPGYSGKRDIFLCGEDIPDKKTDIFIDNDFCTREVNLPVPVFHLDSAEKITVLELAANQKITSTFFKDSLTKNLPASQPQTPFYNKPDEILIMDKYIDLPTIEDYFSELLGQVNMRKFEGRKIFRFNNPRTEMTIYDPLVLIDWVAVSDINKILAMSPRMIDRIELVNAPYIKGSITYGGIISFFSKKNDFAGIDLPSSGTFINYSFLEGCRQLQPEVTGLNLPDARNTVFWDPDIRLSDKAATAVRFRMPDTPGKYLVILQAVDGKSATIIVTKEIEVREK
jgi:hypothetical protein